MEEIKKYNRKEMEERLPSYIFGELNEAEKHIFETSVEDFPDIQDEIIQVRRTFDLLDRIDYDKVLFDKTKDLPTRVVREITKTNKKSSNLLIPFRFLIPAFVTAALLFIAIKTGLVKNYWQQIEHKNTVTLTKEDKIDQAINEVLAEKDFQDAITQSDELQIVNEDTLIPIEEEDLEKFYEDFVFDTDTYFTTANIPNIETYITIDNHLNDINEEIFEQIMEDLKNAKL